MPEAELFASPPKKKKKRTEERQVSPHWFNLTFWFNLFFFQEEKSYLQGIYHENNQKTPYDSPKPGMTGF